MLVWSVLIGSHADAEPSQRTVPSPAAPRQMQAALDPSGLLALELIVGLHLSPNGRFAAYGVRAADLGADTFHTQLFVLALEAGAKPTTIGDGGQPQLSQLADGRTVGYLVDPTMTWSADGKWLVYARPTTSGSELWRVGTDGKPSGKLAEFDSAVVQMNWSPDSARLYLVLRPSRKAVDQRFADEARRGYLYDSRFWPNISREPFLPECGEKSTLGIPVPTDSWCRNQLFVYDFDVHALREASPRDSASYQKLSATEALPSPTQYGPTEIIRHSEYGHSAWLANTDPKRHLGYQPPLSIHYSAGVNGSVSIACHKVECTGQIRDLWLTRDGATVYYVKAEGHADSLTAFYRWTPTNGAVFRLLRDTDLYQNCGLGSDEIVCEHESAKEARTIVAIDVRAGIKQVLVNPNPQLGSYKFPRVERINWFAQTGDAAFADLVYPVNYTSNKKWPLVVVQYRSRGFLIGGVGDEYPIYPLAEKSMFVLSYDYPTDLVAAEDDPSASRGWSHFHRDKKYLGALQIELDRLVKAGVVDSQKIGITGLSEGAEIVCYALIHTRIFSAAAASTADWAPEYIGYSNDWLRQYIATNIGRPDDLRQWKEISIGVNARNVNVPLLLQVPADELLESLYNYNMLRMENQPVEMYVFPDANHIKWRPAQHLSVYRRTVQWFQFWLQGIEDQNPVDDHQFARWRKFREIQRANERRSRNEASHNSDAHE